MSKQKSKKCLISEQNKKEIFFNLVNSVLAGGLVFLGSLTNGFSWEGVYTGAVAAGIVALTKFYDYWKSEASEYQSKTKLFTFVGGA